MKNKMKENAQRMENKMDANAQALRGDMQTQRGEMQSMGLNLQVGQEAMRTGVRGIMVAPCGGATEPTRSVQCVWPAMDTGEVRETSDAITVIGETETCRVRHEGMMEKVKEVTEMQELKKLKETTKMKTETRESEEVEEEVNKVIDEHTHRVSGGQWG